MHMALSPGMFHSIICSLVTDVEQLQRSVAAATTVYLEPGRSRVVLNWLYQCFLVTICVSGLFNLKSQPFRMCVLLRAVLGFISPL